MKVPIACTLTPTDAADRVGEWREFFRECVLAASLGTQELRLTLAPNDAALTRAADLSAREKQCCAFFSFSIDIEPSNRVLVISVPAEAGAVLDDMTMLLPPRSLPRLPERSWGRGVRMSENGPVDPSEVIDAAEAASILEVTRDRIDAMVEQGLLTPVEESRFRRSDVLAAREVGG